MVQMSWGWVRPSDKAGDVESHFRVEDLKSTLAG